MEAVQRASKQAECSLVDLSASYPRRVMVKLTMRAGAIGAVIGRGGANIRSLKATAVR